MRKSVKKKGQRHAPVTRVTGAMAVVGTTLAVLLSVSTLPRIADAQIQYRRGQNVQPVFEGWERNADGSFNLVFGYLNRNYEERPSVPIGDDNFFSPGEPDRGQPAHFYPRRQSFVFKVRVLADFGEQDLVWTVTHNGRTDTAYGSLWPVWEIDESVVKANRGMGAAGAYIDNSSPTIRAATDEAVTVTLPDTVELSVIAGDDGIPGPDPEAAERRGDRRGRPGPSTQDAVNPRAAVKTGLAVTWLQHRGPGTVGFTPSATQVDDGLASTTARFSAPGTYVVRAIADDTVLTATVDMTVVVSAAE